MIRERRNSRRAIGGGRFLDLRAPARKRRTPERMAQLHAYAIDDPDRALAALLECAPGYADLTGFARDRAYQAIEKIHFEEMHYRKDIGRKAL